MRVVILVSRDTDWALELATAWARAGDVVTLVLCDDAAARARESHPAADSLEAAARAGITVLGHDQALAIRGIGHASLATAVKPVDLDELADLLVDNTDRAVWL